MPWLSRKLWDAIDKPFGWDLSIDLELWDKLISDSTVTDWDFSNTISPDFEKVAVKIFVPLTKLLQSLSVRE